MYRGRAWLEREPSVELSLHRFAFLLRKRKTLLFERERILLKLKMVERGKDQARLVLFGRVFVILVIFLLWDGF